MESVTIAGGEIDLNDDGAQRLPASWNRSHHKAHRNSVSMFVLNAFRHHGIGHLADPVAPGAYLLVLNAFRHHGIGHFDTDDLAEYPALCSTPSGIMESVT